MIKTYLDLWIYICEKGQAREFLQFYVANPNEVAIAFWNGYISALESAGIITKEIGFAIWYEITGEPLAKTYFDEVHKND